MLSCTILTFSPMETELWRAVCAKSTCTVRREGRVTTVPTPIRDINKKFPFRSEAAGVVSSAKGLKTHSDTFRRADHPGCAISVASRLFVSAQPPLLFKEGKASCPHFSCFIATFLLESLVQKWPISERPLPEGEAARGCHHCDGASHHDDGDFAAGSFRSRFRINRCRLFGCMPRSLAVCA